MPRSLSLEQFVALNEEMAAMVRAGAPLDRGLAELGADVRGPLGAAATSLAERIERGEPLEQIVADEAGPFPPLMRAVMAAGMRSGNLAAALEGLATTTRRAAELRRTIGVSLLYPLFVLAMAMLLFAFVAKRWAPVVAEAYRAWEVSHDGFIRAIARLGERPWYWAPWLPLAAVAAAAVWWVRGGRAARMRVSGRLSAAAWFPTLARLSKAGRMATFADLLRLLIEHRVPLPAALLLAGEASGDRRLEAGARAVAERLNRGGAEGAPSPPDFPPLVAWLLAGGAPESQLVSALNHVARAYRNDALRMAHWLAVYLPLMLTAAVGGTTALVYSLSILGPVFSLYRAMGQP